MTVSNLSDFESVRRERLPGTRLMRVEVYNWGTFDRDVWSFDVAGSNALLTGDIGSGKSTLVDAITTLLLPSQRIFYNRAAGADNRERTLRSYVEGYYKAERNERTGTSRPVGLRDATTFSVILGVFGNIDFDTTVTLAQVFRTRQAGDPGQPDRFFVVADRELSIRPDFFDFGTELTGLKRTLRSKGAVVKDSFPEYGRELRRRLGIESEQAMDLFHQTVSMKAVDDLTEFVRSHMLEPFDTQTQVATLVEHFENLTKAHEAVVRARHQLELLTPLVADLENYDRATVALGDVEQRRQVLPIVLAERARGLFTSLIATLEDRLALHATEISRNTARLEDQRREETRIKVDIAGHGGDRLAEIDREAAQAKSERPERKRRMEEFNHLLAGAGLDPVSSASQFVSTRHKVEAREAELKQVETEAQNRLTEASVALQKVQQEADAVNAELRSLESRRNNLPSQSLVVREELCNDLKIDADELPFAGELIRVHQDAAGWEGAAERVLHGFALSMLVPTAFYEQVAAWINDRHLGTRLVYYRVPDAVATPPLPDREGMFPLLLDQLEVKPDTPMRSWLEVELVRRANHVCVDSTSAFRTVAKAVTRTGQIKDRDRHEKDDRRRIDDRRQYVLGWSNEAKVSALIKYASAVQTQIVAATSEVKARRESVDAAAASLRSLSGLAGYQRWEDLDWEALVKKGSELEEERQRILATSDQLSRLHHDLEVVTERIETLSREQDRLLKRQGSLEGELIAAKKSMADAERILEHNASIPVRDEDRSTINDLIDTAVDSAVDSAADAGADRTSPLAAVDTAADAGADRTALVTDAETLRRAERAVLDYLDKERTRAQSVVNTLGPRIVKVMANFRNLYPQETADLDASVEAGSEFRELHRRVSQDDLPRFEREFKDYLNQNTIRDIAGFAARLNGHERDIRDRIGTINASLVGIDYNEGRYIRLMAEPTSNVDVRQFRSELRDCTDDVVSSEGDQYSEHKFLQVKKLIDRFKGREGFTDADRAWTRRVTDVRQWFEFSASERWRNDDTEYEHYADSGGKSGGQKEKLAYTILAASLAYQFKLDFGSGRSRSFRFVVIDEAFGRGSEASTRYALNLFTRLGLQLLIVTPLQKIHVIEPHVAAVGFVDNPEGHYSRLQSLTITEFRRRIGRGARRVEEQTGGPAA
ncbi:MAG: SbcC/MukB-like Walker B domain-containing protein [Actinomycetota bacterium]|nr:SbcC/MukB-like Walker B domain-containing protein [Actinomycetota bacterium]